ncbi:hypothetical protein AVEN_64054-1 [Araneus ventricosus]|uniref:Uncharacterized protein n=1 Tax=Araneus ventricosus TaxID=182803 RepID=A0A4Y2IU66_ARAVE|nr:hypothetical protein AVEN_64054-1 [Araneus ventricosus]
MSTIRNYNIDNNTLVLLKNNGSKPICTAVVAVIPKSMREQALIACHDVGHIDAKKLFITRNNATGGQICEKNGKYTFKVGTSVKL